MFGRKKVSNKELEDFYRTYRFLFDENKPIDLVEVKSFYDREQFYMKEIAPRKEYIWEKFIKRYALIHGADILDKTNVAYERVSRRDFVKGILTKEDLLSYLTYLETIVIEIISTQELDDTLSNGEKLSIIEEKLDKEYKFHEQRGTLKEEVVADWFKKILDEYVGVEHYMKDSERIIKNVSERLEMREDRVRLVFEIVDGTYKLCHNDSYNPFDEANLEMFCLMSPSEFDDAIANARRMSSGKGLK